MADAISRCRPSAGSRIQKAQARAGLNSNQAGSLLSGRWAHRQTDQLDLDRVNCKEEAPMKSKKTPKRLFKKPRQLQEDDPLVIAYHEAGHAVVGTAAGLRLEYVTIAQGKDSGALSLGHAHFGNFNGVAHAAKGLEAVMPYLAQVLAGVFAERMVRPEAKLVPCSDFRTDYGKAIGIAAIALHVGPVSEGSKTECNPNDPKLVSALNAGLQEADRLVNAYREAIIEVAELLRKKTKLSGDEVRAIVRKHQQNQTDSELA
jgi:hypothetical protein